MDKSNDPLKPPRPIDSKSDYAPSTTTTHSLNRNGRSTTDHARAECSGLSSSSVSLTNIPSSNSAFKGPDSLSKISDCDISLTTNVVDTNCDSVGKNPKDSVSVQTDSSDNNESVITIDSKNILPQTDNKTSSAETERKGTKRDSSVLTEDEKPNKPVQKKKRCFKCSSKLELAQREMGKYRCNDPKTQLDEKTLMLLSDLRPCLKFNLISRSGELPNPSFTMTVKVNGQLFEGSGTSKEKAKLLCAENAFKSHIQVNKHSKTKWQMRKMPINTDFTSDSSMLHRSVNYLDFQLQDEDPLTENGDSEPATNIKNIFFKKPTARNPVMILNALRPGLKYDFAEVGKGNRKKFIMSVMVDDQLFEGIGRNKKMAKSHAAQAALTKNFNLTIENQQVPGEPKKVKVEAINSTTVYVQWRPPVINERIGIIRGYQVHYAKVNSRDEEISNYLYFDTKDGDRHDAVITGLDPDTKYSIQVVGYTRRRDGIRSQPRFTSTKGAVPSPPRNLNVHLIQEDPPTVQVTWQRPRETHGDLLGYRILWGRVDEHFEEEIMSPDQHKYEIRNLDKGATYEIRVYAKNDVDWGERAVENLKTPEGIPQGSPLNFTAIGLSETTVRLIWDLPARDLRNGDIVSYQITYHRLSDPVNEEEINVTDTAFDIMGLEMNTDYKFQIKAYTSKGAGPWSPQVWFRTFGRIPSPPRNLNVHLIQEDPPTVQVTWQRPRETHGDLLGYRILWGRVDEHFEEEIMSPDQHKYEIRNLDKGATYEIRVYAKNDVDWGERAVENLKTPEGIPQGSPLNFTAIGLSETTVRLIWDLPARDLRNGDIVSYQITYHRLSDPVNEEEINVTDTAFDIMGLEMNTDYKFQIKAYTSKGAGPWSPQVWFRTFGRIPSPPRNLNVHLIQEDPPTVQVTWQRPRETHGDLLGYRILWGRVDEHFEEEIMSPDQHKYEIRNLDKGATYEIRVYAKNDVDWGERAVENLKTPEGIPRGSPLNFTAIGLSETTVRLIWDLPARDLRNGDIVSYQITYHRLSDPVNEEEINVTDTAFDIMGLEMNTDYKFQIKAYTSKGAGPWSPQVWFRTFGRIPSPPRNLNVHLIQEDPPTVRVKWQRPRETHGDLLGYGILWGRVGEHFEEEIMSPDQHTYEIRNLDKGATYEIQVYAKNSVDWGERAVANLKTPEGIPQGSPLNFTAIGLSETTVRLIWDLPARDLRNGDIVSYLITYHSLSDPVNEEEINVTDTAVDIMSLEMNTDYKFQIKAYTSKGAGPWSPQVWFRTFGRSLSNEVNGIDEIEVDNEPNVVASISKMNGDKMSMDSENSMISDSDIAKTVKQEESR